MTPRATPMPPERRREEILRAARPLLLEHGGSFTTKQVAEAAGIAEGTLFRIFPTKRELTAAVIGAAMDPTPICGDLALVDPALPLDERVTAVVARLQLSVAEVTAVFSALLQMAGPDGTDLAHPRHDEAGRAHHQEQARMLQQAIEEVLAPDAARLSCPVDEAAAMLQALAFATAHPHQTDVRLKDPARLAHLVLHGITRPATQEQAPC